MKNNTIAKCWTLAALLMFVTATLQIVNENFIIGAVNFGAATCFLSAAKYRKKEAEENEHNGEEQSHE